MIIMPFLPFFFNERFLLELVSLVAVANPLLSIELTGPARSSCSAAGNKSGDK
jgi:hypothetical protein